METTPFTPFYGLEGVTVTGDELAAMGYTPREGDLIVIHIQVDGLVLAAAGGALRLLVVAKGVDVNVANLND
jgi:hypothetical protein